MPRTDQFREVSETEVVIDGIATRQDHAWYLMECLREFLSIAEMLERDANGNYLARDPRAGVLASVRETLVRVHTSAQIVLASCLMPVVFHSNVDGIVKGMFTSTAASRPIADAARSLVFQLSDLETRGAMPAQKVDRIRSLASRIGELIMSDEVDRLQPLQAEFQSWARETLGVRVWIEWTILPSIMKMIEEQERLLRERRDAINELEAGRKRAWDERRSLAIPPEIDAMYDRDADPRHMDATRIGQLRDEGRHAEADLAEAFAVLAFHDAGEAGGLHKLMPIPCDVVGLSFKWDLAYFARCDSGLERRDWEPRFSAQVMEGMIGRFRSRFASLKKPRSKKKLGRKARVEPRGLTNAESVTYDTVTRHAGNFAAAAREMNKDPSTVRENYSRAAGKLRLATAGSRSVSVTRTLPRDSRGNENLEGSGGQWAEDGNAYTMPDDD